MPSYPLILAFALFLVNVVRAEETVSSANLLFRDSFQNQIDPGWNWIRERKQNWRCTTNGLEVLVEPGNMWGPQNDAQNVLVRAAPRSSAALAISITVSNAPSHQYEQSDLVWYFDDSNMVKVGQELVDGKLSVVMGREERDKTRTISITPLASNTVTLRMIVHGDQIRGYFKTPGATDWTEVGLCDMPKVNDTRPARLSLQFYQGVTNVNHWVHVTDFQISRFSSKR